MPVETAHNPGHVDALFVRLQADRARYRSFKRQIARIPRVKTDRQAEIRNTHVLDLLFCTTDQTGWSVLQVRQGGFVTIIHGKTFWVDARKRRIAGCIRTRYQPRNRRIQFQNFCLACTFGPLTQYVECGFSFIAIRCGADDGCVDIHRYVPCDNVWHTLRASPPACQSQSLIRHTFHAGSLCIPYRARGKFAPLHQI